MQSFIPSDIFFLLGSVALLVLIILLIIILVYVIKIIRIALQTVMMIRLMTKDVSGKLTGLEKFMSAATIVKWMGALAGIRKRRSTKK